MGYYEKVTYFIEKKHPEKFTLVVLLLSLITFALHILETFYKVEKNSHIWMDFSRNDVYSVTVRVEVKESESSDWKKKI